jgi:hypothetical protein
MAAMDANDDDDLIDDEADVTAHRARAREMLDQITRQAKQALAGEGIDLFFLIPNSGDTILMFGTPADPDDKAWNRVGEIVSSIVRQAVSLDRVRCRPVMCATTDLIVDYQPTGSPAQPAESSGCCAMSIRAPAAQHAGAEV